MNKEMIMEVENNEVVDENYECEPEVESSSSLVKVGTFVGCLAAGVCVYLIAKAVSKADQKAIKRLEKKGYVVYIPENDSCENDKSEEDVTE